MFFLMIILKHIILMPFYVLNFIIVGTYCAIYTKAWVFSDPFFLETTANDNLFLFKN